MPGFYNKRWIIVTAVVVGLLYLHLVPRFIYKYGVLGTVALIPVFVLMAAAAYTRGWWVSTWFRSSPKVRDGQK